MPYPFKCNVINPVNPFSVLYKFSSGPTTDWTFVMTSAHSPSRSESHVIAPPAPILSSARQQQPRNSQHSRSPSITIVRITTLRSALPHMEKYPSAPE